MELEGSQVGWDGDRGRLSSEVFGLLWLLVHRTSRDAAAILDREGLNPAKFQLLLAVRQRPGAAQRELGEHSGVTGGNVSMLVSKLEGSGLLRREARGAANRVWLTETGQQMVDRLAPQQTAFMVERFEGLGEAELEQLHRLLAIAVEGLPATP